MTDAITRKERQVKNSFIYFLPTIVSDLLPFVTLPIFTRILTKEDYGLLALATIYGLFAAGLANFGMTSTYERNYFQYRPDRLKTGSLVFTTTTFVLINFLLIMSVSIIFGEKLSVAITGDPENKHILIWAFAGHFFYNIVSNYYLTYLKNTEDAKQFSFYKILARVLTFIISLYLISIARVGIIGIVQAQFYSGGIVFILLSVKFLRKYSFRLDLSQLVESLKIGFPLTPRIFLGVISTQFDKYMINLLSSLGGTGIYHLAKKMAEVVFTGMTALQNVFNPQVYSYMFDENETNREKLIGEYLTPFIYISCGLALGLALAAEEMVRLLTTPEYYGATEIVMILSLYFAFLFFGKITGLQLIYSKKTHITSLLSVFAIGLNIALNIPMIMKYGPLGAATATLISALISGSVSIMIAQRYMRIDWEFHKLLGIYSTLFLSIVLLIILKQEGVPYIPRFSLKLLSVATYAFLGYKIGVISRENAKMISGIFSKKFT